MGDANDAATLRRLALLRRINALLGELAWDGEENPALYDAARKATHGGGMPWTDPRTGVTHQPPTEPPDRLQIRPATDAEQREAILRWAQQAHRQGSGHDCSEWLAGFRCTVCGAWIDADPN